MDQVVVAAELTQQANDVQQLAPMLTAIRTTLTDAGVSEPLQRLAADCGYWSIANVSVIPEAPELLIPPARHGRHGKPRKDGRPSESKSDGVRAAMRAKLDDGPGKAYYAQRSRTIEPSLRAGQDGPGRHPVHAPRAGCLPGRVAAAVWRPQPAQALARHHGTPLLTSSGWSSLSAPGTGAASEPPSLKPR
jgi:hypothetical protein